MKIIVFTILAFIGTYTYGQQPEMVIDSSKVQIIGNELYKVYQSRIKEGDSFKDDQFKYSKFDLSNILFKTSKIELTPSSHKILDELSEIMLKNPAITINIAGHTDKVGNSKSNLRLSSQRAKKIQSYLLKKGVEPNRITATGYGDEFTICEAPCKKNQRVELSASKISPEDWIKNMKKKITN